MIVMSEECKAALKEKLEAQRDWWGRCRECGLARTGTPAELRQPCSAETCVRAAA